jgi:hypothetical protein
MITGLWEILEILSYGVGFLIYFTGAFFFVKRTYDINMEEIILLKRWWNSWLWSPLLEYRLFQLNSNHTRSYLLEKYKQSKSDEDFVWRCNSLRPAGNGIFIFRY